MIICAAGNCDATDHLFTRPKWQTARAYAWTRFVISLRQGKNREDGSQTADQNCFPHFKIDDFSNLHMY